MPSSNSLKPKPIPQDKTLGKCSFLPFFPFAVEPPGKKYVQNSIRFPLKPNKGKVSNFHLAVAQQLVPKSKWRLQSLPGKINDLVPQTAQEKKEFWGNTPVQEFSGSNLPRSSREVRTRVPIFFRTSVLAGNPTKKVGEKKGS